MYVHIPTIVLVLMLSVAPLAHAEPGKIDIEAAEMAAELIGAPVFSKDGTEVGEVADISFDDELQPDKLRMTTGAMLGLGTRIFFRFRKCSVYIKYCGRPPLLARAS